MNRITRGGIAALALIAAVSAMAPSEAARPVSPAQRLSKDLPMSKALQGRVAAYPGLVHALKQHANEARLCAVLTAAAALRTGLESELSSPLDEATEAERIRMGAALKHLVIQLPGVVALSPEGFNSGFSMATDYGAIGLLLPASDPARTLLVATGAITGPYGWPDYIRPQTDVAGCFDPMPLKGPLSALPPAWRKASPGVRSLLAAPLRSAFKDMSEQNSYCDGPSAARSAVGQVAALLRQFPELNGPALAEAMARRVRASDARFNFVGG